MKQWPRILAMVLAVLIGLTTPLLSLAEVTEGTPVPAAGEETPAVEETPATSAPTEVPETQAPATEAPATEVPATETPVAVAETDAPVTTAPETEAPVTETPEAVSTEAADGTTTPPEATPEATETIAPTEETNEIDYTQDATQSLAFIAGSAFVLRDTEVFSNSSATEVIGTLGANSMIEVSARVNTGASGDGFTFKAKTADGEVAGFIFAKKVRPASPDEVNAWENADKKAVFTAVSAAEATVEGEEPAATDVPVAPTTDAPTESPTVEDENALMTLELGAEYALPGSVNLPVGTATSLNLAAVAGGQALGSFTMSQAGLLNMSFANLATTSSLTVVIKDSANGTVLCSKTIPPVHGDTFIGFVDAGNYDVIINKLSETDVAPCTMVITPTVTLAGELGTMNYTQNNAAALTLGSSMTGIYSMQDVSNGRSDYYKLTLSTAGRIRLSVSNLSTATMHFALYGDDTTNANEMTWLGVDAAGSPNEDSADTKNRTAWLDAGTYYFLVTGTTDGRYTMRVEQEAVSLTEKERNNTPSLAYNNNSVLSLTTPTTVSCMMSDSMTPDYFFFNIPAAAHVTFNVATQFSSSSLQLCRADGSVISGTQFGQTGTPGAYGKAYAIEKSFDLAAGNYYLLVRPAGAYDPVITNSGLYSVSASTSMNVSSVTGVVTESNGSKNILNVSAAVYGGYNPVTLYRYNIYLQNVRADGTTQNTLVLTRDSTTSSNMTFTLPYTGTYLIQFVCSDGTTWKEGYTTVTATLKPLKVETLKATSNAQGQISITATTSGYYPVTAVGYALYKDGGTEPVATYTGGKEMSHTFTAPADGNYLIQFVCSDGYSWADGWTTCNNVKIPAKVLPLSIPEVRASSDNAGNINVFVTTKDGYALSYGNYVLYKYDATGKASVVTTYLSTKMTQTFKVTSGGSYSVQFVGYDGVTWADGWALFNVSLSSKPLSIASLSAKVNETGLITATATAEGGKKIQQANMYLYNESGVLLAQGASTALSVNFQVANNGKYLIQCVAYDGTTWADKWTTLTVSGMTPVTAFTIDSLTLTSQSNGALKCVATIGGGYTLKQMNYYLYNASGTMIDYIKTTNALSNTFYIKANGIYNVQAVGYNGTSWTDKWTQINVTNYGPVVTKLAVDSLTAVEATPAGTVSLSAKLNMNSILTNATFYLYKDGKVAYTVKASGNAATISGVANGAYNVQYVVSDGVNWADRWSTLTVGSNTFTINSTTANVSGRQLICTSTVTSTAVLKAASYYLYNGSVLVGSWTWSGSGTALTHTFDLSSIGSSVTTVQYVIFDGSKWIDKWASVQ